MSPGCLACMGGSSSKPTGGGKSPRNSGGSAEPKPKGEPLVSRKFDHCSAAHKTDPGFGADEDDNQDCCLITDLKKDEVTLYALFDGHGHQGKAVAELVKDCTVEILGKLLSDDKKEEGITAVFAALDAKIASSGGEIAEAGCSATLVVYDRSKKSLLVSNVGDTTAVLGAVIATDAGALDAKVVTEQHLPGMPAEKSRIVAAGGQVRATDDLQLGELGGQRVWKGDSKKPGLPLSRSLGDALAKECGVVSTPWVKQLTLGSEDRCLVLASSGVWKVFSPQEVIDIVAQETDAAAAAAAVLTEASKRWEELWQGAPPPPPPPPPQPQPTPPGSRLAACLMWRRAHTPPSPSLPLLSTPLPLRFATGENTSVTVIIFPTC